MNSFWANERGLSLLLVLLVLMVFILPLAGFRGPVARVVLDVAFSLLLVAGAMTVWRTKVGPVVVGTLALAALIVRGLAWYSPSEAMDVARALSLVASTGALAIIVLVQVLRAGPVNLHRILGAIAVYLLLGIAWSGAYEALSLMQPAAFSGAQGRGIAPEEWIYFSFVSLTTVGYGDITPVAPAARSFAVLEALTGQLYPALLLARLVSLQVSLRGEG
jgi:hypothetical protein